MRRILMILAFVASGLLCFAQGGNTGNGGYDGNYQSLAERVLNLEKKNDAFNMYFNYGSSFQMSDATSDWTSAFRAKQLRWEVKGTFGDHLSYRLRHRMNKANAAMSEENFAKATDIMMVGWKFNDKLSLMGGKMCQFWGGFEFDENPMYIYQYSDMVDCMDNFLAGAALSFTPVAGQEFVLNISNSYSGKFADEYGAGARTAAGKALEASNHPLAYIFNWNGSFFDGMLNTRWAVGSYTQGRIVGESSDLRDNMVFIGTQLNLPKFQWYVDYMGAWEGLDRLRIATSEFGGAGYQTDVNYNSFVTKANWQFAPGFNLMAKGMFETATVGDGPKYRTSLGYIGSLEYYPDSTQDFRVFLAYIGRKFAYSNDAMKGLDYNTNRIEIGFMYRIKAY